MAESTDAVDVLVRGIVAKWQAETSLGTISGPFRQEKHTGRQSNPAIGTDFPYCVIFDAAGKITERTCSTEYWQAGFSFHVYAGSSPENLKTQVDKVRTIFDSKALVLTLASGWTLVNRESDATKTFKDDKNVWHSEVSYRFKLCRTRPA